MQGTGAELAVLGADQWAIHADRDTLSHPRLGVMARPLANARWSPQMCVVTYSEKKNTPTDTGRNSLS